MAKQWAKAFYRSKQWANIRQSVLMRDKYICQICGAPATEVHHIKHITEDNIDLASTHQWDNLISLCRDCHCRQHDKDRYNSRTKKIEYENYYFDEQGYLKEIPPQ